MRRACGVSKWTLQVLSLMPLAAFHVHYHYCSQRFLASMFFCIDEIDGYDITVKGYIDNLKLPNCLLFNVSRTFLWFAVRDGHLLRGFQQRNVAVR